MEKRRELFEKQLKLLADTVNQIRKVVFLGDKDSKSALSTFGFPELIKTSEVTLKVGYQ